MEVGDCHRRLVRIAADVVRAEQRAPRVVRGVLVALRDSWAGELLCAEREVECLRQVELGEQDRAEQIEQLAVEVLPSLASRAIARST